MADDGLVIPSAASCSACAKINLFLEIAGRRADGYHDLASLMTFVALSDHVCVVVGPPEPDAECSLEIDGSYGSGIPGGPDNLAVAAAQIMVDLSGRSSSVRIQLTKNLPPAAGLGGGSADAAAVIRGMAQLWGMDINTQAMREAALSLGADVPFFLGGHAAYVTGIGESLVPVAALPPLGVVLVNPGQPLSTRSVFQHYARAHEDDFLADDCSQPVPSFEGCDLSDPQQMIAALAERRNDLTSSALELMPPLRDILDLLARLDGVLLARMSGSGATCFGLFADHEKAEQAATQIRTDHRGLWVMATSLITQTPPVERIADPVS